MNKDIPIIFSAPMVQALLDSRKTMTRRLLKPQTVPAVVDGEPLPVTVFQIDGERPRVAIGRCVTCQEVRFAPGDRLWVRENWALKGEREPMYAADWQRLAIEGLKPWRPSIHMPRWVSRLTLTVTAVKIERLQDVSREDAIAEGCTSRPNCNGFQDRYEGWSMDWSEVGKFSKFATGGPGPLKERDVSIGDPRNAFGSYINRLHNGDGWNLPGKPTPIWDENPEIVAVTFTVHNANIDAMPRAEAA